MALVLRVLTRSKKRNATTTTPICDNCQREFSHGNLSSINSIWNLKQGISNSGGLTDGSLSISDAISTLFSKSVSSPNQNPPSFCRLCAELLRILYDAFMEFSASKNLTSHLNYPTINNKKNNKRLRNSRTTAAPNYKESDSDSDSSSENELAQLTLNPNQNESQSGIFENVEDVQNPDVNGSDEIIIKTEFVEDDFQEENDPNYTLEREENEDHTPPPKRTKRVLDYFEIKSFANLDLAKEFIEEGKEFTFRVTTNSNEGTKHFYYCRKSRRCDARMYFLMDEAEGKATQFHTKREHSHEIKLKTIGILEQTKFKLDELWQLGIRKPSRIRTHLTDLQIPLPTKLQLKNYLNYRNRKSKESTNISTIEPTS